MDLTTLLGILLALIGLLGGMYYKGVPFIALLNPAAILIILVGTTGAVLNAFTKRDAKNIPALFKHVFLDKKNSEFDSAGTIKMFVDYAQLVRKDGILALEPKIDGIESPFLKRGLTLLLSGVKSETIEEILFEETNMMEKRHAANAQFFSQAGMYAPTLGVLGAVIGLIAALANMSDQESLGHAISAAFVATLYGIFTGYVLWHPFANKLKRKSKEEAFYNSLVIEGILSLADGDAPYILQEKMLTYLPKKDRKAIDAGNPDGGRTANRGGV